MEISSSNPGYDDYREDYPARPAGTSSTANTGFREIHVLKSWAGSDSKQYIVGPPMYQNGRIIHTVTCMTTSRQMEMVEEDDSSSTSTEESSDVLVFVTENGDRIVMRSESDESGPKPDEQEETSQDGAAAKPSGVASRV